MEGLIESPPGIGAGIKKIWGSETGISTSGPAPPHCHPPNPIIRRILNHYKIYPAQLSPNVWRFIVCSLVIWLYYKRHMSCDEFRYTLLARCQTPGDTTLRQGLTRTCSEDYRATYVVADQPVHSHKKGWKKRAATKDSNLVTTSPPSLKGIVIQEKQPRDDAHDTVPTKKGEVDDSKGKEAMPPPSPKRTKSNKGRAMRPGRAIGGDHWRRGSFHFTGQQPRLGEGRPIHHGRIGHQVLPCLRLAKSQLANMGDLAMKTEVELKDKSEAMARLEVEVAELTSKLARAKKLAIEEFKSSDDFKDAFIDSVATYFGEGFEFCKRQLLHHHPNLGINLASMDMDTYLAEEEEEAKVGKKEEEERGRRQPCSSTL
ncbi:growth-regulating factor 2 [Actinidia rufa]|uniref:Growth-regulating factor 2 n=1 Tax=Actinidia rufa TaxID=165716 RepID=A0A7J0DMQ2_9ERIC|nr:growth-regulating factor 2 [Actinidia rufa]